MKNFSMFFITLEVARVVVPVMVLLLSYYMLIYTPQQEIKNHRAMLMRMLRPGCMIEMHDQRIGEVLYVMQHSVIILCDGEKCEILKQMIRSIDGAC